MDLALTNAHILITGASGGIGLEITPLKANVTAHYNTNPTSLHPLQEEYGLSRIAAVQASLSREDDVTSLFTQAATSFGPVQVIVVNHGYWNPEDTPLTEMSLDRWNATLDDNLTSAFLVSREYLRGLVGASQSVLDGASIVFVGSTAGKYGEKGHADYATAKSALMYGLTRTLKNEIVKIAPKGRVNCVAPGWTMTPKKVDSLQDPAVLYRACATTPLKKVAQGIDIANQIAILASTKVSGHVTGEVVVVAGGMEGRLLNAPEDINSS